MHRYLIIVRRDNIITFVNDYSNILWRNGLGRRQAPDAHFCVIYIPVAEFSDPLCGCPLISGLPGWFTHDAVDVYPRVFTPSMSLPSPPLASPFLALRSPALPHGARLRIYRSPLRAKSMCSDYQLSVTLNNCLDLRLLCFHWSGSGAE
jgi:hypothetical protein